MSRSGLILFAALAFATCALDVLAGEPVAEVQAPLRAAQEHRPATPPAPDTMALVVKGYTVLRLTLVTLAAVILLMGRPRRGRAARLTARQRRVGLSIVATVSLAANYNFFVKYGKQGFHVHEVFHYYLGAKYFPELGYYGLYECSALALVEENPRVSLHDFEIRDLRTHRHDLAAALVPSGVRCGGAFGPERWQAFKADLGWFGQAMGPAAFFIAVKDYGYNPSPVWTLIGRPLASLFPAKLPSIILLSRLDLVLTAVSLGFVGWAFGFEGFWLAALVWSANPLSRYQWVGDAFLRYAWLASSVVALCCLKKGRHGAAGALLALSSLLRLFPAMYAAAYGLWAVRPRAGRALPGRDFRRFLIGASITGGVLITAAAAVSGRGFGVYGEFIQRIRTYSQESFWNSVGLRPLLSSTARLPDRELLHGRLVTTDSGENALRREVFKGRRPVYVVAVALLLVLLWRATERCRDWEAAALGFPLIMALTAPPTYYMSCVVPLAFVAGHRPRLRTALLVSLAFWCVGNLLLYRSVLEYGVASAVAVALAVYALIVVRREPPADDPAPPHSEPAHARTP